MSWLSRQRMSELSRLSCKRSKSLEQTVLSKYKLAEPSKNEWAELSEKLIIGAG